MISRHKTSCFIALKGKQSDGHLYIDHAVKKGATAILSEKADIGNTCWFQVKDSLKAYQKIAKYHRENFDVKVLAITGSNGKTTVKEWLSQMIKEKIAHVKSPKSYNSQIGVAYSLLEITKDHKLAIIETGISTTEEMSNLEEMIAPDTVIFTNIGDAHQDGFIDTQQKIKEKLILAKQAKTLIFCRDHKNIKKLTNSLSTSLNIVSWGHEKEADILITSTKKCKEYTILELMYLGKKYTFQIPFVNPAEQENAMHVISYLLVNQWTEGEINQSLNKLEKLALRLEKFDGINDNIIINDSYSSDLEAFKIAVQYLNNNAEEKPKIIITNGLSIPSKNHELLDLLKQMDIHLIYWLGNPAELPKNDLNIRYFNQIQTLLQKLDIEPIKNSAVLIKGSNILNLNLVAEWFQFRKHKASLNINLGALGRNINELSKRINPDAKIMASIKAAAYGSGATRIAKFLEHRSIDYLAVAYIDEAIELRKNKVQLPILIFNFYDIEHTQNLQSYDLDVVVYSFEQLSKLNQVCVENNNYIKIHIEFDTGMHRLGFNKEDTGSLIKQLNLLDHLEVVSVFSHLASSDAPKDKAFTLQQLADFKHIKEQFETFFKHNPLFHILNSNGIWNYPEDAHDMVRLGIAMYGVGINPPSKSLEKVHSLQAKIIQIRRYASGDSIGYNRAHFLTKKARIATVNIGYADGIPRNISGKWHVFINGEKALIVGKICMDLLMIDVSDISAVKEGDSVEIFGDYGSLDDLAKISGTIPYEILARISPRIRRLYIDN